MNETIKVGISHGDINGISYELILKSFEDSHIFELLTPVLYGSSKVLAYHRKTMELPSININTISQANDAGGNRLNIVNCGNEDINVELSQATPQAEQLANEALEKALKDLKKGVIDVLVAAPSNIDETHYLQEIAKPNGKMLKILVDDSLRIALATDKLPLTEIASHLSVESLTKQIKVLHSSLISDFMITMPRIAVLSFNPGVGIKEKQFGKEETEIILPAVEAAKKSGIICFGPYSADDFFGSDEYKHFDAILAIYHDQGLLPFRTISAGKGVIYRANSTHVATSPDQNASYEKAGKNLSSADTFRNALYTAIDIFRNRKITAEINANPLRKQYFEKGSDNEKLDLTKDE
ncbi:4-hydroxythreonine-4-phosphate dehydrogenase PdxA [Bacteroidales bacterium OttesenSCG-928-A17]|nr:4-hydroxythreonine-4-phosphate dehydrogenase PdxA [Bacteroidales bacterium OttesenSCG-928-A17]